MSVILPTITNRVNSIEREHLIKGENELRNYVKLGNCVEFK